MEARIHGLDGAMLARTQTPLATRSCALVRLCALLLSTACANAGAGTGTLAAGGAGNPALGYVGGQAGTAAVSGAGSLGVAATSAGASAGSGPTGATSMSKAGSVASSPSVGTTAPTPVAGAGVGASAGSPAGSQAGGGTGGSTASGGATSAAAGGGAAVAATFTAVWDDIIQPKGCTSSYCHGQGQGQGGLLMSSRADAYKKLVGVPAAGSACGSSGKLRVKPSEPAASVLLDKLSHATPSCGEIMPIGAKLAPNCVSMAPTVCTTEAEISLVRDWITAGAQDN